MNNPPGPTLRGESREKEGVQIGAAKKKKPKHFFIRNESDKEEEEEKYTEGGRWKKKKLLTIWIWLSIRTTLGCLPGGYKLLHDRWVEV